MKIEKCQIHHSQDTAIRRGWEIENIRTDGERKKLIIIKSIEKRVVCREKRLKEEMKLGGRI